MENVALHYDEQARDAGVYIVSACGFDCIPNDLGALLLQRTFNGDLAYVESFMKFSSKVCTMCCIIMYCPNVYVSSGPNAGYWGVSSALF